MRTCQRLMIMHSLLEQIKGGLVVSCQAEGDSPFNSPEGVAMFAMAARMGGAAAIRSEGVAKTRRIVESVDLPVIGLKKSLFDDQSVRITGTFDHLEQMIETGCDMVAVDGTFRHREGMSGPDFIKEIKRRRAFPVMADIATPEEAAACREAGADCVSTTLSGYTPQTASGDQWGPDLELVAELAKRFGDHFPVVAEGRYNTPALAGDAIKHGAWAVVVGTAITRPQVVTKWFRDAIEK